MGDDENMKAEVRKEEHVEEKQQENLKGTLASVMILGGFLILSWLGVWILYLVR